MSDDIKLGGFMEVKAEDIEESPPLEELLTEKPFFSVIIPAHNAAAYMAKGLNSIAQQSFTDFELIVVCDACNDETESIAREYTDRVYVTRYGLDGMARNAGIDAARGEWLLFMDDDDWWMHRQAFQIIADNIRSAGEDIDMAVFDFWWKGRGIAHQSPQGVNIAVWCKAWRRSFIGDTRFPPKPYWSDVDFNAAMMAKNPRVVFITTPLYNYNYLRPGSISWRKEQGEIE